MSVFSFEGLAPGRDTSVRVTDDGLMNAVDLAVAMSGKDRDAASKDLRMVDACVFPVENFIERKMPGSGNSRTKLVSFKNAILLIMVLPGKTAKETRVQFADIIRAHLANGSSSNAITQLARDSIADDPSTLSQVKRPIECDAGICNLDADERKAKIALMNAEASLKTAEANQKNVHSHKELLAAYLSVCSHTALDDTAKAAFKASMLSTISPMGVPSRVPLVHKLLHAPGEEPINISSVAADMGFQLTVDELKAIGCSLSKAYIERYNVKPSQHVQQVAQGKMIYVNSYTKRDIDLMKTAISEFLDPASC
jgi:hypothetical protein